MFKFFKNKQDNKKIERKIEFKEKLNSLEENVVFKIENLSLWYKKGEKQALKNVSANIAKNHVTALIGPSGCGKSTFLRELNRMNDTIEGVLTDGNIFFEGKNIKSKKLPVTFLRTRVGMVFQKPTPFPISIYDNIAYGPRSNGIHNKKVLDKIVENALKSAALWEEVKNNLKDLGTSLSGGQQQRLCIARAIAIEPHVLLMDEPTSALDPIATAKVEELILKLKDRYSIVIVTHSMSQAQRISDDTLFFYAGEIVEANKTKEIFLRPQLKRTRDYINGRIG
ncbi:phosphate ABC transporter ATP-binding protein PstB [[Mycoplasma] mobile]|uniref:Phosphate import ATP-binding protein PstB n=1 Tax=Mycoplasma mobile (strain ATCC 43663 / 163K / NCTC 11711) TaxID=267748 RepID=PSTB_MYCM1|nr:phosphate ABC transporter ATP-binding protein PstB [[Mycoplasma] mobile]Q6KIS8.1 RecName: Full=Phosphate import ATP-binding protein PstB; AltName: Full=ABC phosphate transporter; AltName: Full=Phosphate-transporting ATPase [Mycoplasma mobile 163K]AAT27496.1 phosphate ABC transporter ATP-binding protein [Mycoplasma mobile 163K]